MGGTYTRVGDYYLPALALPAEKEKHIGVWGQRHAKYLKQNHKVLYMNLFTPIVYLPTALFSSQKSSRDPLLAPSSISFADNPFIDMRAYKNS